VNKRYFQEDERITSPSGQQMSLYGKLKEADLKVTLTLPYAVSKNQLSSYICRCTGFFSEDMEVKIGYLTDMSTMEPKLQEPQKYCVLVPLLRGYLFRKPALDYFNTTEHDWVHFTLCFPGAVWPTMKPINWRIRIKVSQLEDKIECVSVSSNAVDVTRMKESWFNVGCWLRDLPRKFSPFIPFSRPSLGSGSQSSWGSTQGWSGPSSGMYGGPSYQQQFQSGMASQGVEKSGIGMNLPRASVVAEVYQQ